MKKTKRITLCAILVAMALVLSCIERLIPLQMAIPLPGVKLGLANIVSIVALYLLGPGDAMVILMVRCAMGAIFGGGVTGFMFSIAGGVLAMLAMILASKMPFLSIYGVSLWGATAHNVGQVIVAMGMMQSIYVGMYLPYLMLVGILMGLATGAAASGVLRALRAAGTELFLKKGEP